MEEINDPVKKAADKIVDKKALLREQLKKQMEDEYKSHADVQENQRR